MSCQCLDLTRMVKIPKVGWLVEVTRPISGRVMAREVQYPWEAPAEKI